MRDRLHRQYPGLEPGLDLVETVRAVHEGAAGAAEVKTLIVLDQFEQWLAAHPHFEDSELLNALRLCSQSRVQCLLLVRDGFLLTAKRFLDALDVPVLEGRSWAIVEPFSTEHAVVVLTEFGRAYDRFDDGQPGPEQIRFMKQAVAAMAKDEKVICVELALYADMIKDQPWTPATLKGPGDLKEVGKTFLEAEFRFGTVRHEHEKAARGSWNCCCRKATSDHQRSPLAGRLAAGVRLRESAGRLSAVIRILADDLPLIMPVESDETTGDTPQGNDRGDAGNGDKSRSPESGPAVPLDPRVPADPLRAWLRGTATKDAAGTSQAGAAAADRGLEGDRIPQIRRNATTRTCRGRSSISNSVLRPAE